MKVYLSSLSLLLSVVGSSAQTLNSEVELSRYVGIYTAPPYYYLAVTVDGDVLKGDPASGKPPGTLLPLRERGRFQLKEASFEIQFLQDKTGNVYGLEMTGGGTKRRMRRTDDAAGRASIKAVAVNTETSVNAQVFNGYTRTKDSAGKFQSETYVVGSGGFQSSGVVDESAEKATFEEIVRTLAPGLAKQRYTPAPSGEKADLLLMVYWGATASDDHPAVISEELWNPTSHVFRGQLNRLNARLLGFKDAVKNAPVPGMTSLAVNDVVEDLEASRYWVAVVALDFEALVRSKSFKTLWSIRYNVGSRGTNFTKALPGMTEFAALYFGRDSGGLVNPAIDRNNGKERVEIGDMKVVEDEAAPLPPKEE